MLQLLFMLHNHEFFDSLRAVVMKNENCPDCESNYKEWMWEYEMCWSYPERVLKRFPTDID